MADVQRSTGELRAGITVLPLARISGGSSGGLLGTCFAVGKRLVATAYHVVAGEPEGLIMVIPPLQSINEYQDTTLDQYRTARVSIVAADPIRDLCVLELNNHAEFTIGYKLSSTDSTPVGSLVFTHGYPHASLNRIVLTQHEAKVGARVTLGTAGQNLKHMVLNTQAREGQSGSPVFDAATHDVAAILIGGYAPRGGGLMSIGGIDPATLHQTTHAISAEYLREML